MSVSKPTVVLEKATENHIDAYISLERKLGSRTYSNITDRKEVARELVKGPVYLLRQGDAFIGMCSYWYKPDGTAYISGLTIDPAFQGKGLGRAMMEQILVKIKDAPRIELHTHPDNIKAVSLYKSLGFEVTGRIENYFGDGEPRLEMSLIRK